jgi:AcrR family transcriptional regulator
MSDLVQLEPLSVDVPQTKRGHERCVALIESAAELFLQNGYEAVSLDDIVQHAGGSKATIYKYFGNKEGLFRAICDYRREQFKQDITLNSKEEHEALAAYLIRILTNFIKHIVLPENTAFIRLVLNQAQKDPDLALHIHESGALVIQKTIADALEQEHLKGHIYCPEPEKSAILYFGIIRDYEWRIILGVNIQICDQELDNHIQYCVDRFLDGHQKR